MLTTRRAWLLVALGALGISFSGPLTAALTVPALAVAFWRSALGSLATAAAVVPRGVGLRAMDAGTRRATLGAGVLVALHFALWLPSLRMTSVAVATALAATTPVWTVVLHALSGRPPTRGVVLGVGLAMAGVVMMTGFDAAASARALLGDLLALGGGITYAGYAVLGERVRRTTSNGRYTLLAYSTCAALLLIACLGARVPIGGYPAGQWAGLVLLTLTAQLLGHSGLNLALPVVGSTALSLAMLFEVPGAALIAWVWLGQVPPLAALPGALAVLAGLWLVTWSERGAS